METVDFEKSRMFGVEGERLIWDFLLAEMKKQHESHPFDFQEVTRNRVCQFAGLDFAIKKEGHLKISALEDLSKAVIDAIEIKSHLWVNFNGKISDLVFEMYSDYEQKKQGWTDKSVQVVESGMLPFIRIFWINKKNLWVATIQLNLNFCGFWKHWKGRHGSILNKKYHRINSPSTREGHQWTSSFSPVPKLILKRSGIPCAEFRLPEEIKTKQHRFNEKGF